MLTNSILFYHHN